MKWRKLHNKKELNWDNDDDIETHKHLWSVNMKILLDHVIKESGDERKFGFLPEMCCNSPVQLGVLTSEIFPEIMISADNLLVDTHRLHLNDDMIDKLVVLCVNKKFMDRVRIKNGFLP